VLVVEYEPVIRDLLRLHLSLAGLTCTRWGWPGNTPYRETRERYAQTWSPPRVDRRSGSLVSSALASAIEPISIMAAASRDLATSPPAPVERV
jgi:hypothetical protein